MGLDVQWWVVLILGISVVLGSIVQGSTGFGVSLLGIPVLMLLDPTLMPGSMLVVGAMLPLFTLVREGRHIDWSTAWPAVLGRALGTSLGVWVVTVLSTRSLAIGLGLFILLGVALSVRDIVVPMNRGTLVAAGALTGITGTAASVAGPIIGLVMQRMPGAAMRATMAMFFSAGTVLSLLGLAVGGELTVRQVLIGLIMLPFLTAGYLLSGPFRAHLDKGWTRPAVLSVSCLSAIVVLAKAFWL